MPEYTPPSNDAVDFALESYSPPNSDAVDFALESYSPPNSDAVDFEFVANSPPSVVAGSEQPTDGATGIAISPTLSIDVEDPDGDTMSVSFYDASDDSQISTTQTGIADGGTASVTWNDLPSYTNMNWYVVVDDGSTTTQSSNFTFLTGWDIYIDGQQVTEITADGDIVNDITADNNTV